MKREFSKDAKQSMNKHMKVHSTTVATKEDKLKQVLVRAQRKGNTDNRNVS